MTCDGGGGHVISYVILSTVNSLDRDLRVVLL